MSQSENRKLQTLLLSVLCLVAWQCAETSPVLAQRRPASNAPPETPSQRWLPLPQGDSADLKQQVQWLQQLKGLVGTDALRGETSALPKFNPEQLKTLVEAMKQLGGDGLDGAQPSELSGITPEQVSKALTDPVLREQVRGMLDQFSREGKLPRGGATADSQGVPFPPNSPKRGREVGSELPDRDRPDFSTNDESTAMPRAMQELLQRLADQAGSQPNGPPPERDPATGGLSERESTSLDSRNELNRPSRSPAADQRPAVTQPRGTTPPPGVTPTESTVERPGAIPPGTLPGIGEPVPGSDSQRGVDRTNEPKSAPSFPPSVAELLKKGPMLREQPFQTGSSDPRSGRSNPGTPEPRDSHSAGFAKSARPSMSDAATGGSTNGARSGGSGSSGPVQTGGRAANRERASDGIVKPTAPSPKQGPTPAGSPSAAKSPRMDVRSELEEQGFAQTLRKIVEQARDESLLTSNDSAGSSAGSAVGGDGTSAGLEGSVTRMLDGVRNSLVESASVPPVASPESARKQSHSAPAFAPQSTAESPSSLSQLSKAAGSILSDIATPPASKPAPVRSTRSTAPDGKADSPEADSRSAVGLLVLLAVLGLVWYFVPHLLTALNNSRLASGLVGRQIQPADIRSRADVVRAFHQYALRPTTPAPTWWTHREVERQVAQATPALRPTIQTLTDLYEQARYLPDDTDFTPDQIGSARRALEQCENASEPNFHG